MSAIVSLSGHSLQDCGPVVQAMRRLGIYGDVTSNTSIDPMGNVEPGCRVTIGGATVRDDAKRLWHEIRSITPLTCAHVQVSDVSAGCVFDVFRPTACPHVP